jgi:VWFA-related protein
MPCLRKAAALLATVLTAVGGGAQTPPEVPVSTGVTESIEVRLVTVNVVALDSNDRTVADLGKDDFELIVEGKRTAIDTLDLFCDGGPEADPHSLHVGAWTTPKDLGQGTRRVVLAFDYLNLTTTPCPNGTSPEQNCPYHTMSLQTFQQTLAEKGDVGDEQMMVVALTGGLRVEQPFTNDRAAIVASLHRMEHDISLWNGNFAHLTDEPVFRSLGALVNVLHTYSGPKAVVYITAGQGPSNRRHELDYEALATAAGEAQVSFYPVDCVGADMPVRVPRRGGVVTSVPQGLARLATSTGGRLTSSSNDYTIGYARARRDLGCRYTLGYYDHHPELDREYRVTVNSRRAGVHLIYATRYSFPSNKARRAMNLNAAYIVPHEFEGGGLRAHLFPVQLKDSKTWSAILAVDFPVAFGDGADSSSREFGVALLRGTDVVHKFNRTITLHRPAGDAPGAPPRVTFVEPVDLPPGTYALTAVLSEPEGDKPYGTAMDLTLPAIPKHEAVLVGPILGRRRGDDVVVYGSGASGDATADRVGNRDAFRPLLIEDVDRGEPLAALTHACVVGGKPKDGPWSVARRLETAAGEPAGSLADITFAAEKREKKSQVQCERLFDELPIQRLKPGGYTFRAVLTTVGQQIAPKTDAAVPFAVQASGN